MKSITLTAFIFMAYLNCPAQQKVSIKPNYLIGKWRGICKANNSKPVLIFNSDHTGSLKWPNVKKSYLFKYSFKSTYIIRIQDKMNSADKEIHEIHVINN